MDVTQVKGELRNMGKGDLLALALNQKISRCVLYGNYPFYMKHNGFTFCIPEILNHGCQEKICENDLEEIK
jgi:hypothetical protein